MHVFKNVHFAGGYPFREIHISAAWPARVSLPPLLSVGQHNANKLEVMQKSQISLLHCNSWRHSCVADLQKETPDGSATSHLSKSNITFITVRISNDKEEFRKWLLNWIFHAHLHTSLLPLSELYFDMKQIHEGNSFFSFLRTGLREFLDVQYDTQKCLKGSFHISPCQDELHIRFWSQRYICFSHCWRHWRCNWFTFEHF